MSNTLKIISWNINSIRSRVELFKLLLKNENPDIVLLQETKVTDDLFPFFEFEDTPYNIVAHGQKSYNGVAVFSKSDITILQKGFDVDFDFGKFSQEARFLYVSTFGLEVASLYAPNGQEVGALQYYYKLDFYDELIKLMQNKKDSNVIIAGDYNIAFEDIDVYNPKSWAGKNTCSDEERQKIKIIKNEIKFHDVWRDLHKDEKNYSWWDYRFQGFQKNYGLRIDYFMTSDPLKNNIVSSSVLKKYRGLEKPSDHAPIEMVINI